MTESVTTQRMVPEGYVVCLIPQEMADEHAEWRECRAVRIVQHGDGTATVEVEGSEAGDVA